MAEDHTGSPGVASFQVEDPQQADVRLLIEELDAEMAALSVCGDCDLTSAEDLSADYVQFLVARYHSHPKLAARWWSKTLTGLKSNACTCALWFAAKGFPERSWITCSTWRSGVDCERSDWKPTPSKQLRSRSIVALALNPAIPTKITSQRRDRTLCLWSYSFSAIGPFCPRWRC